MGALNDYMFPKYFKSINNNETYDKIVHEALIKHGFKLLKIGTGNFLTIPTRFLPSEELDAERSKALKIFEYQSSPCLMCQDDMMPDQEVLRVLLEESVDRLGGAEIL
jgi:hypothetical protein